MQKVLTIYKFNIPFIDEEFEMVRYNSILEDLENMFLYAEILETKKISENNIFKTITFKLKDSKAVINIYKCDNAKKYFIPRIEFSFYGKNEKKIIINIFDIFISIGRDNYIFDYNEKDIDFNSKDEILTLETLEKSLKKYNYNYLNEFLKNTPKEYISEELMSNKILRNSFYYIIYLCFGFYNNLIQTEKGKEEIENILKNDNLTENTSLLILSETRLNIIEKDLLINFMDYKKILDKLFNLLLNNKNCS